MPMSGGSYVAPTWVDNGPPALDATELQAMSDTIELSGVPNGGTGQSSLTSGYFLTGNGTSPVNLLDPASVASLIGASSIQTGSYVGTGQYGIGNPNTLDGNFPPKLLLIYGEFQFNGYTWGTTGVILCETGGFSIVTYTNGGQDAQAYIKSTVSQNSVSWYSTMSAIGNGNGSAQLNRSGTTYDYALFG